MPLNYMETGSLLLSKVSVNRLYFFDRLMGLLQMATGPSLRGAARKPFLTPFLPRRLYNDYNIYWKGLFL